MLPLSITFLKPPPATPRPEIKSDDTGIMTIMAMLGFADSHPQAPPATPRPEIKNDDNDDNDDTGIMEIMAMLGFADSHPQTPTGHPQTSG